MSANASAAPRSRPVPQRRPEFEAVSLEGLRTYRRALGAEEGRVSYWRRLVQARLDILNSTGRGSLPVESLRGVFGQQRIGLGRVALTDVVPADDMPPLPDLGRLWDREVDLADEAARTVLTEQLTTAEEQLSAYRTALHRRLEAATHELIARYREDPLSCLSALPREPGAVAS